MGQRSSNEVHVDWRHPNIAPYSTWSGRSHRNKSLRKLRFHLRSGCPVWRCVTWRRAGVTSRRNSKCREACTTLSPRLTSMSGRPSSFASRSALRRTSCLTISSPWPAANENEDGLVVVDARRVVSDRAMSEATRTPSRHQRQSRTPSLSSAAAESPSSGAPKPPAAWPSAVSSKTALHRRRGKAQHTAHCTASLRLEEKRRTTVRGGREVIMKPNQISCCYFFFRFNFTKQFAKHSLIT